MEEAAKVAACSGISLQTVVHHSAHHVLPGFRLNRQPKSVRRDELREVFKSASHAARGASICLGSICACGYQTRQKASRGANTETCEVRKGSPRSCVSNAPYCTDWIQPQVV